MPAIRFAADNMAMTKGMDATIQVIERDVTQAELDRMQAGFAEHAVGYGIAEKPQARHGFVAVAGERFIGCASGLMASQWFSLTDLWVEKEYRKRGLGGWLLSELEKKVQALGIRHIYTWTAGYEAPGFYRRQGYEVFGELKEYYSTGHSRIGFRKELGL